jgi:hypothetical protein
MVYKRHGYTTKPDGSAEDECFAFYLAHIERKGYITPPMKTWEYGSSDLRNTI